MAEPTPETPAIPFDLAPPTLEEMQHWTGVLGRAQQLMLEHAAATLTEAGRGAAALPAAPNLSFPQFGMPAALPIADPARIATASAAFWEDSVKLWSRFLAPAAGPAAPADTDRRFAGAQWREPVFDLIRQSYLMIADHLLKGVELLDGVDPQQKEQMRFATRAFVDAMSPSNFALTNPQVLARTMETRGANLLKGLEHMLADMRRGQMSHTDPDAFEVGRNIAMTPGKVIHETPLYQLIQYAPSTETVAEVPVVIFPPWINRFYILDLSPEKSFVKWATDQGLTVFMVSWRSADAETAHVTLDDYVSAQLDAIDTVRDTLDVSSVHAVGYCVAGTTLATTLALLHARGDADKVKTATFFTAQVDFSEAGDLKLFIGDEQLKRIEQISATTGTLDGRYMAATFNLLRGRDLIWNYVVNNYLMGEDYAPFDMLHWNGDTANLPAAWHKSYLSDLYRDNKLARAGALTVLGTPIDLSPVATPTYAQAGREDHIAPAASVWKITRHFRGPLRFVLAGSGHIAGVVNPPARNKYQYWTNDAPVASFEQFVAGATETKGSWWPDWRTWLAERDVSGVEATGSRIPGAGRREAIEDAPGRYVRMR